MHGAAGATGYAAARFIEIAAAECGDVRDAVFRRVHESGDCEIVGNIPGGGGGDAASDKAALAEGDGTMNIDQILKSIREEDPGQAVVDAAAERVRANLSMRAVDFGGRLNSCEDFRALAD